MKKNEDEKQFLVFWFFTEKLDKLEGGEKKMLINEFSFEEKPPFI